MRKKMADRTKAALVAGLVLLLGGAAGVAYLETRPESAQSSPAEIRAYYAANAVAVGTPASTALAQGSIRPRAIAAADRPTNAVTDASQIAGRVAAAPIPADTLLTTDMFPDPQTRIGTFVIPPGMRALAIELPPVPGIAGFAGAGDRIDVYAIARSEGAGPGVRLVLQGVDVLSVNGTGLPAAQGQPGSPNLIYLLAVTPADAERLLYLNDFEKLYFDLVPKGEGPVTTPGAGPAGALAA